MDTERFAYEVEYWEYEQALELPYGYVITPTDVPKVTPNGRHSEP
jgi:hypothetical protein